ncbi:YraN family protein [Stratiformator vulcanicus]|uniref:UPF0102 protein Pan189_17250 n=1 Tax=Stratiformator vulcanicus TaxID=2527980 RepID=A0A517R0C8_9PLAN|nr:YraN family protein [Stratiformator vulcanicus]QDT37352.1 hypothetical protein Pan189_17250 [Stratiformator vulcanicus]
MLRGLVNRVFGNRGERAAARFLKARGLRIIARQYRSQLGEVDLIADDHGTIAFVEVKARRSWDKGHPAEAVTAAKRRQLTRIAISYLKQRNWLDRPSRFDVISVTWPEGAKRPQIDYYPNAFEPTGIDGMYS